MTLPQQSQLIVDKIKAEALRLGFCLCGITDTRPLEGIRIYKQWIERDFHDGMAYLASPYHLQSRVSPATFDPAAQSVIVLGWPYRLNQEIRYKGGMIAGYASGSDYHQFLQPKMKELVDFIQHLVDIPIQAKLVSDSAPILERELGQRAGLGWIGRNSCLISPIHGSNFLLSEILLDLPLLIDSPFNADRCGNCHRCVETCPTGCITQDRTIDASRCISYLNIENKGQIPEPLRSKMGKWLFGCDACQVVCPWNQKSLVSVNKLAAARNFSLVEMINELSISQEEFKTKYSDTPIYRAKWQGFIRNLVIVLANEYCIEALPALSALLASERTSELKPTINWAISKIATGKG